MSEDRQGSNGNQLGGFSPNQPSPDAQGIGRRGPDELGLKRQHDVARATYGKMKESRNLLDHIRQELDKLTSFGDAVTPSDVMGAAGRLVGHGVPAKELATLLADMPLGAGQNLASWLQAHDVSVTQQERMMDQIVNVSRHRMGVAAFRELAGDHVVGHVTGRNQAARMAGGQLGPQPQSGGMPQTSVMQVAQRPNVQGPGAEEAA